MELSTSEQAEILRNPYALVMLMDHHDMQQEQADSMGADCYGNELRHEELRQLGAQIIAKDPDLFDTELRRRFKEPTGYRLKALTRAREATAAVGVTGTRGETFSPSDADGGSTPADSNAT